MFDIEIDAAIQREVPQFLYNNGEGAEVSVKDLVEKRNQDRGKGGIKANKSKQKSAKEQAKLDHLIKSEYDAIHGNNIKHGNSYILSNYYLNSNFFFSVCHL